MARIGESARRAYCWEVRYSRAFATQDQREVMSTQVMVTLPDEVFERAQRLAQVSHREVSDLLAETIAVSLPSLRLQPGRPEPVATLTDAEVIALTDLQLPNAQDQRLTMLLDRQQSGTMTETERAELAALFQLYQEGLLRKAQALAEAVHRGLREPLTP
jgi:hypothetical protein